MYNLIIIHTSLSLFCTYDRRKGNPRIVRLTDVLKADTKD